MSLVTNSGSLDKRQGLEETLFQVTSTVHITHRTQIRIKATTRRWCISLGSYLSCKETSSEIRKVWHVI